MIKTVLDPVRSLTDIACCVSKYAEIWTQAKYIPSSANWEPAWRGAREIKPGNKIEWICSWALPSKYPKANWCKDQWDFKKGLADFKGTVIGL